jgi:hypothetical protein
MSLANAISVQEVRRNPLRFLDALNQGKTLTVIYRSKPYSTVTSVQANASKGAETNVKAFLTYVDLARSGGKGLIEPKRSFKEMYYEDMAKKYGIS